MDSFSRRPCKSLFVLLMLFAAGRGDVQAAAITWTGTTSSSWGTATNWTGINTPPQSNDSLVFGTGAGGTLLNNLTSGPIFNVAGLTFSAGAGAFVINSQSLGNGFSLTGDVLNSSTTGVLQTINNSFSLSGTRTFTTTATGAGGNLLLGGTIDGAGGLTAAGGGSVMLTGANTYSGGSGREPAGFEVLTSMGNTYAGATTVSGGKLSVGVANAIPATSNASIGPAGTLDLGSFNNSVAGVQLTGGSITGSGVLTSASAFDLQVGTVSAGLGGSAGLTKTSAGTVTLSSSNSTYTGATTLNGGTLAIGSLNAIPSGSSLTIASGATLDLGTFNDSVAGVQLNGGNITGTGQLTSTGTYNAQSGSVSANLAGAAGLTQAGPGTLTLGGSNNIYTGPTAINGGTLLLTGKITGSPISVAAGGVLSETAAGSLSGASALGAAGVSAVVAESFARIFFRNCVATGELYPYDSPQRLCNLVQTGDVATLDFEADTLTVNGQTDALKPLGAAKPVIDAGGLFNYARQTGMIPTNA